MEEARQINLAFKIAGQISAVNVTEGQKVSEGQLLATLDDSDYKLEKDAVEIQYKQLSDEVERTRVLYGQKSVSKNDFEKAEAGLRQLGIQLQGYENKLAYTRLYAPIDCYIQTVNFDPGEMVNAGTTIFELICGARHSYVHHSLTGHLSPSDSKASSRKPTATNSIAHVSPCRQKARHESHRE